MLWIFTQKTALSHLQVSQRNESGDYEGARSFSNLVLFCDILVFVYYVLAVIAVIATVVVLLGL